MTPATIPALRRSSTRRLYFVPEAYLVIIQSMALWNANRHEIRALAEFQQTNPFSDGEPCLQDYWNAFVQWREAGDR